MLRESGLQELLSTLLLDATGILFTEGIVTGGAMSIATGA